VFFYNFGVVEVKKGTLNLTDGFSGGYSDSGGIFNVSSGTTALNFVDDGYNLQGGTKFLGAGRSRVVGKVMVDGVVTTDHPTLTDGSLELAGGTLVGNSGAVLMGPGLRWADGTMQGVITIGNGVAGHQSLLTILGTGTKYLTGVTLNNKGVVDVIGSGNIAGSQGAVINNSGVFKARSDANFYYTNFNAGNLPSFNNLGTGYFLKGNLTSTSTTTTFTDYFAFNNYGDTAVTGAATLELTEGYSTNASFTVNNATSHLDFKGSAPISDPLFEVSLFYLEEGTKFLGPGASRVLGTVQVAGTLTAAGGSTGKLEIAGGIFYGNSESMLSGNGFTWTGGTLGGEVTVKAGSTFNISGDSAFIDAGSLINEGAVIWINNGPIYGYNGAAIIMTASSATMAEGRSITATPATFRSSRTLAHSNWAREQPAARSPLTAILSRLQPACSILMSMASMPAQSSTSFKSVPMFESRAPSTSSRSKASCLPSQIPRLPSRSSRLVRL